MRYDPIRCCNASSPSRKQPPRNKNEAKSVSEATSTTDRQNPFSGASESVCEAASTTGSCSDASADSWGCRKPIEACRTMYFCQVGMEVVSGVGEESTEAARTKNGKRPSLRVFRNCFLTFESVGVAS